MTGGSFPRDIYPQKIAITSVEHKALLDTCAALEQKRLAEIVILPVDDRRQGASIESRLV